MFRVRQLVVLAAVVSAWPALALDPNRALTQYVHRIWQTQQGVPPGTIYGLWLTRDGYLWLGTQTGLLRFDGVEFRAAESLFPKMPENVSVRGTGYEDEQGAQWLPTNDHGVLPGRSGEMWVCTERGLARIDTRSGGKIHPFPATETHGAENVRAACLSPEGGLWSGGDSTKLSHWNGNGFDTRTLTSVPADVSVRALVCSGDTVWAGTSAGLIRLQASNGSSPGGSTPGGSAPTPWTER